MLSVVACLVAAHWATKKRPTKTPRPAKQQIAARTFWTELTSIRPIVTDRRLVLA